MIQRAVASAADLVVLDLEDAVVPDEKAPARQQVIAALRDLTWGTKTRAVRINGVGTEYVLDDVLEVVVGAGDHLDLLIIPKVREPRDVWFVETLLGQLEAKLGLQTPIREEAREAVTAYQRALEAGGGAISVRGRLVDVASIRSYRKVLDKTDLIDQRRAGSGG